MRDFLWFKVWSCQIMLSSSGPYKIPLMLLQQGRKVTKLLSIGDSFNSILSLWWLQINTWNCYQNSHQRKHDCLYIKYMPRRLEWNADWKPGWNKEIWLREAWWWDESSDLGPMTGLNQPEHWIQTASHLDRALYVCVEVYDLINGINKKTKSKRFFSLNNEVYL